MKLKTQNIDYCTDNKLFGISCDKAGFRRFGTGWIVVIGAMLFLSARSARGQYGSFTVTPMKVEALISPGKTHNTVINIQNIDPQSPHTIDLTLVELSQSSRGEWMIVDPNLVDDPNATEFGFDLQRLSSCRSWIQLRNNSVTLQPLQLTPVELSIQVRRDKKGVYTAGILATVRPLLNMTRGTCERAISDPRCC